MPRPIVTTPQCSFPPHAKPIKDFPCYAVTEDGEVFSAKNPSLKIMSTVDNGKGYYRVKLFNEDSCKRFLLHRLVAETYLPAPTDESLQINHVDGNKKNNHYSNLEWCTASKNIKEAFRLGLKTHTGFGNPKAKYTPELIHSICACLAEGKYRGIDIAKKFNVNDDLISKIKRGRVWACISRHYTFSY